MLSKLYSEVNENIKQFTTWEELNNRRANSLYFVKFYLLPVTFQKGIALYVRLTQL